MFRSNLSHGTAYQQTNPAMKSEREAPVKLASSALLEKERKSAIGTQIQCPENQSKNVKWQPNHTQFFLENARGSIKADNYAFSRPSTGQPFFRKSEKLEATSKISEGDDKIIDFATKLARKEYPKSEITKQNQGDFWKNKRVGSKGYGKPVEEFGKEDEEKERLLNRITELNYQNRLLKSQIEQYKKNAELKEKIFNNMVEQKQRAQRSIQLQRKLILTLQAEKDRLNRQLLSLKNSLLAKQTSKLTLMCYSKTLQVAIHPEILPKPKEIQPNMQNGTHYFTEEYKEIAQLMGYSLQDEDVHKLIVNQLEDLPKIFQEFNITTAKLADTERENKKLKQFIKRYQTEVSRLDKQIANLSQDLNRSEVLLQDYNQQIQLLHLKQIESRLNTSPQNHFKDMNKTKQRSKISSGDKCE